MSTMMLAAACGCGAMVPKVICQACDGVLPAELVGKSIPFWNPARIVTVAGVKYLIGARKASDAEAAAATPLDLAGGDVTIDAPQPSCVLCWCYTRNCPAPDAPIGYECTLLTPVPAIKNFRQIIHYLTTTDIVPGDFKARLGSRGQPFPCAGGGFEMDRYFAARFGCQGWIYPNGLDAGVVDVRLNEDQSVRPWAKLVLDSGCARDGGLFPGTPARPPRWVLTISFDDGIRSLSAYATYTAPFDPENPPRSWADLPTEFTLATAYSDYCSQQWYGPGDIRPIPAWFDGVPKKATLTWDANCDFPNQIGTVTDVYHYRTKMTCPETEGGTATFVTELVSVEYGVQSRLPGVDGWKKSMTYCEWTQEIAVPHNDPAPATPSTVGLNCCGTPCIDSYTYLITKECPADSITVELVSKVLNITGSTSNSGPVRVDSRTWMQTINVACGSEVPTPSVDSLYGCADEPPGTDEIDIYFFFAHRICPEGRTAITSTKIESRTGTPGRASTWLPMGTCQWRKWMTVPRGALPPDPGGTELVCCDDDPDGGGGGPSDGPVPLIRCKTGLPDASKTIDPTGVDNADTRLINDECYRYDSSVSRVTGEPTVTNWLELPQFANCAACLPACCVVTPGGMTPAKHHSSRAKIAGFSYLYTSRDRYIDFDGVTEVLGPINYAVRVPGGGGTIDIPKDPSRCGAFLREGVTFEESYDGVSWSATGTADVDIAIAPVFGVLDHPGAGWSLQIYVPFVGTISKVDANYRTYWTNTPAVNKTAVFCDPYEDVDRTVDNPAGIEEEYDPGTGEPTGRVRQYFNRERLVITGTLVNPDCDCE